MRRALRRASWRVLALWTTPVGAIFTGVGVVYLAGDNLLRVAALGVTVGVVYSIVILGRLDQPESADEAAWRWMVEQLQARWRERRPRTAEAPVTRRYAARGFRLVAHPHQVHLVERILRSAGALVGEGGVIGDPDCPVGAVAVKPHRPGSLGCLVASTITEAIRS